jgi:nitrogen regulatory protein P-II 2
VVRRVGAGRVERGVSIVKYIIAIIQPDRLDEVIAALEEEEIVLLTVSDVMGRGRQKGVAEVYRSHVEKGGLLHKIRVEVAVSNNNVWQAVDAITRGGRTGNIGDGKIFVLELQECLRIRTGETGVSALA